ncbi:MAG: serine hydrolase [Polyangiaceae bacterium]
MAPGAELDAARAQRIDASVQRAVSAGRTPGAVVAVVEHGQLAFLRAWGSRRVEPDRQAMAEDTLFDLASLTKPLVTATLAMLLVERGKLALDAPASRWLPLLRRGDKAPITVEQLLLHTAGFPAALALADFRQGKAQALERIAAAPLAHAPGAKYLYSDLGYILLGELVATVAGMPLDALAEREIFAPLAMRDTAFRPRAELSARAASTEMRDGRWLTGEAHDPRARLLGGVAGHAGLFSTAADVARFARMILGGGALEGRRVLTEHTVVALLQPRAIPGGQRALFGDLPLGGAVSHTGFTGTYLRIDRARDLALVVLANGVHPRGGGDVRAMRLEVVDAVMSTPGSTRAPTGGAVMAGIDVLAAGAFAELRGKRVALLTHDAARTAAGETTLATLAAAASVKLVALLSPEHGMGVNADGNVADAREPHTGLLVRSLYGARRRPTPADFGNAEVLVIDLCDVGVRFFTYASTLGYALEAAALARLPVLVVDRPNPLGGAAEGPVRDADRESFVAYHPVPVRHGMTLGELARLFAAERKLSVPVGVVAARGWRRSQRFADTGLTWTRPSPNLPSVASAVVYPGVALLETTNVSVGRGTDRPFQLVGAPWVDSTRLSAALGAAGLAGVRFAAARFTPTQDPFAGQACAGVSVEVTDPPTFAPVRAGLEIARQLRILHGAAFRAEGMGTLLAHRATLDALRAGKTVDEMARTWQPALADFERRRQPFLLYPP